MDGLPPNAGIVYGFAQQPQLAWDTAEQLRAKGFVVELDVSGSGEDEAVAYAAAQGFHWVVDPSPSSARVWTQGGGWREQELSELTAALEGRTAVDKTTSLTIAVPKGRLQKAGNQPWKKPGDCSELRIPGG